MDVTPDEATRRHAIDALLRMFADHGALAGAFDDLGLYDLAEQHRRAADIVWRAILRESVEPAGWSTVVEEMA